MASMSSLVIRDHESSAVNKNASARCCLDVERRLCDAHLEPTHARIPDNATTTAEARRTGASDGLRDSRTGGEAPRLRRSATAALAAPATSADLASSVDSTSNTQASQYAPVRFTFVQLDSAFSRRHCSTLWSSGSSSLVGQPWGREESQKKSDRGLKEAARTFVEVMVENRLSGTEENRDCPVS